MVADGVNQAGYKRRVAKGKCVNRRKTLCVSMFPIPSAYVYVVGLPFHHKGTQDTPHMFHVYLTSSNLGSKDTIVWDEVMVTDDQQQWFDSAEVKINQLLDLRDT